jgi:hypothetical protein
MTSSSYQLNLTGRLYYLALCLRLLPVLNYKIIVLLEGDLLGVTKGNTWKYKRK